MRFGRSAGLTDSKLTSLMECSLERGMISLPSLSMSGQSWPLGHFGHAGPAQGGRSGELGSLEEVLSFLRS